MYVYVLGHAHPRRDQRLTTVIFREHSLPYFFGTTVSS